MSELLQRKGYAVWDVKTERMGKRMEKERMAPHKIAEAFKMVSEQFGIQLPDDFVKVPAYEQMNLFDMGMR